MLKDFDLAAKRHQEIQKEAFAALAAKPLAAAAKWVVSNPMKSLGAGLTAMEIGQGAKQLAGSVRKTPTTPPGSFFAGVGRTF